MPKRDVMTSKSTFRCKYWDTKTNKWSTEEVTTIDNGNSLSCKTTHFTDFAGFEVLTQEEAIDEKEILNND